MRHLKRALRILLNALFNNVILNNIVIFLGMERLMKRFNNPYVAFTIPKGKSLQEIAGYSNRPEINEVLGKIHDQLRSIAKQYYPEGGKVLDVGCGPGLYLKEFNSSYATAGIDISQEMVSLARKECPYCNFFVGDFIRYEMNEKFDIIYSIGVLIYFCRSDLDKLFQKVRDLLNPGGIFYLSYPHAISYWDTLYPDLSYMQYSPSLVSSIAGRYLKIIEHCHGFDGREVKKYDKQPYKSLNPEVKRTYKNSYQLVAQNP